MKTFSESLNKAVDKLDTRYIAKIKFAGGDYISDPVNSVVYNDIINGANDIGIGQTCAKSITFSIKNPTVDLENKKIVVFETVNGEQITLGVMKVTSVKNTAGEVKYTAYDALATDFEDAYFPSIKFPTTDLKIINEICNKVGITFSKPGDFVEHTISKNIDGYTMREMIGYMACLQGKNATIRSDSVLTFRWYSEKDYTLTDNRIYQDGLTLSTSKNFKLTRLTCSVKTDSEDDVTLNVGTEKGVGITFENPFMTQTILNEMYSKLKDFEFQPLEVKFLGDYRLETGDFIKVINKGITYKFPIMSINHNNDGGLISTSKSIAKSDTDNTINQTGPATKNYSRIQTQLAIVNHALVNKLDVETANITYATIENLNVTNAEISDLKSAMITTDYLKSNYAEIDLANIKNGSIKTAMIETGAIGTTQIADGSITDAKIVGLTANKITAGTLDAGAIDVVNLNAANITVGTINGTQIASGSIDMSKLGSDVTKWQSTTTANVSKALLDSGLAKQTADTTSEKLDNLDIGNVNIMFGINKYTSNNPLELVATSDNYHVDFADIYVDLVSDEEYIFSCETDGIWGTDSGIDTVEAFLLQDNTYGNYIHMNSQNNYVFKVSETGRYNLRLDVNKNGSKKYFWNIQIQKGNKASNGWSQNPYDLEDVIQEITSIANGKTTSYYSSSQPTSSNYKTNDIWFDTDDGYKMYYWNGSSWVATQYGASAISTNAITSEKIAASAIIAGKIASGAITSEKIASNTIIADNISANAITSDKILSGAITTDKLAANSVSANKLAIGGDFANLCTVNENFANSNLASYIVSWHKAGALVSDGYIKKIANSDQSLALCEFTPNIFIKGDTVYYRLNVKSDVASSLKLIIFFGTSSSYKTASIGDEIESTTEEQTVSGTITISGISSATHYFIAIRDYTSGGNVYVRNAIVIRQNGTTFIQDGAITTDKIVSNAITANKIATKTITANEIASNTITASELNVDKLSAITANLGTIKAGIIQSTNYVGGNTGSRWNLATGTFDSKNLSWTSNGNLKAISADIAGKVTASSGKIGGWNIDSNGALYNYKDKLASGNTGTRTQLYFQPFLDNYYDTTWVISSQYADIIDGTPSSTARAFWYIQGNGYFYTSNEIHCSDIHTKHYIGNGAQIHLAYTDGDSNGVIGAPNHFRPATDSSVNLGAYDHRWKEIYCINSTINLSDRRDKNTIESLDISLIKPFIMGLNPCSYKLNNGDSGRTHYGMIAQEVETLMDDLKMTSLDFAGLIKSPKTKEIITENKDGTSSISEETIPDKYVYGLRYGEFISPMIKLLQNHEQEIAILKNELYNANKEINNLRKEVCNYDECTDCSDC